MPPTQDDIRIRDAAYSVIERALENDQNKKGMFNIFWSMYSDSDLAELMMRQQLRCEKVGRQDYDRLGRAAHKVMGFLRPRIIRNALEASTSRLFLCDEADAESVIDVWGKELGGLANMVSNSTADFEQLYGLFFGNYMRAGMSSVLHVYQEEKLSEARSYFISFLNYCLTGEKNYPRMVWDKESPFTIIMEQRSPGMAWKKTYIAKWKRPQSRTIEEILREFLHGEPFEDDLYGRKRRAEWDREIENAARTSGGLDQYWKANPEIEKISVPSRQKSGQALLQQYNDLTRNSLVPGLAQFHYQCFWHKIFTRVYERKEWGKTQEGSLGLTNKSDVAYLLFQNREVIGELLAPVPLAEATKLTKQDIGSMLEDEPPLHTHYRSQKLSNLNITFANKAESWVRNGFPQVNQNALDGWLQQISWTPKFGTIVGEVNKNSELSKPISNNSGQLYIVKKIVGPKNNPTVLLAIPFPLDKAA